MRLYKLMVLIFAERCDRPVGITRSVQMVWLDSYCYRLLCSLLTRKNSLLQGIYA